MPTNGFIPPTLNVSPGFEWLSTYDELLEQIAATNVVDADWPILRDILKYKLEAATKGYLSPGPPWPPGIGKAEFTPEDSYEALGQAFEILDSFQGPPFTVQRLCELSLHPLKHYKTLPKYFRALTRVISVTSVRSTFTEDDSVDLSLPFASTSASASNAPTLPGVLTHSGVIQAAATIPTRRPAAGRSPMSSPKAIPVVVPLLSPIPWLVREDDDMESVASMDLADEVAAVMPPRTDASPSSSARERTILPPPSPTKTPTGGLVDEVDPGSGTQEVAEPVALTMASLTGGKGGEGERKPKPKGEGGLELPAESLRERFVRASSPRVERGDPEEERKPIELAEGTSGEHSAEEAKMEEVQS